MPPKEIMDYYMKNYDEKVVPLSVKTIKGIAKILVEEKLEVDLGKYGVHYISTPPMSSGTIC